MSYAPARTDTSIIGRWWWTVDRWMLAAVGLLLAYGIVLTLAASPSAAARVPKLDSFHFVRQQLMFIPLAVAVMLLTSLLTPPWVRRSALLLLAGALVFSVLVSFVGSDIKGARRWLTVAGFAVQPSEFIKPGFAVVCAWLCATARLEKGFPGRILATILCLATLGVLAMQPDIGMAAVVFSIWFCLMFLAGLSLWLIGAGIVAVAGAAVAAYMTFPHVAQRVNLFLDPASGDNYQVDRSLGAFINGGIFGKGPGEGTVKGQLPDAHSDFIFAVAGEEFGLLACLLIVGTYAFIVLRGFARVMETNNLFILFATVGLLAAFGLQAVINMASTLHLMPTKGMTLPFISYGGSSIMALALGTGMILALTRNRAGGAT